MLLAATPPAIVEPALARAAPNHVVVRPLAEGVELRPDAGSAANGPDAYATLPGPAFHDGELSLEVSGEPLPGATAGVRGFVGLAFRLEGARYEAFYLRMTNGRAHDQLQRNHAAEYISHPDWPWERLRKETPGVYESYVDLQPGVWTPMRIVVCGAEAALYVHGATQPTLLVHDLKRGAEAQGALALWIGPGTLGRFRRLSVKADTACQP